MQHGYKFFQTSPHVPFHWRCNFTTSRATRAGAEALHWQRTAAKQTTPPSKLPGGRRLSASFVMLLSPTSCEMPAAA
eukprot:11024499-Lingulodinium_polyedra.AAC.1